MSSKRVDTIRQSGEGLIRCHSHDSIPLLGLSPQGNNVVSTPSVCGHCLSLISLVSELYKSDLWCRSVHLLSFSYIFTMSSGNITDSSNNGSTNSANKIDWQCVTSPNLIEEVDDLLEVQIAKFNEQLRH